MTKLLDGYESFVANINDGLSQSGIDRDELALLDHLGYRTESMEEYEAALEEMRALGTDMGALIVEERPISVIALAEPLRTGGWVIPAVEVLAPKDSSPYPSGIEHAEFVTVRRLLDFEKDHSDLNFKRDAMTRDINPELKYRENGTSVKFHRLSILTVVELTNELAAQKAAKKKD